MAKIISLINQKGGVGKTTSTNAIAVCLKHKGRRVLCIDFDPQGYLSFSLGADSREKYTIYDVLKHTVKTADAIQRSTVVDVIPANGLLTSAEREFTGPGCESILSDCLKQVSSQYDYIVMDSPPELGLLSANAVVASDVVLIPGLADGYSLQGVIQVHETISRIKNALNPKVVIGGMFLVRFYPREGLSQTVRETTEMLAEQLNIPLLRSYIRHSNVLSKAMSTLQCDMIDYAPKNNAVQDYMGLVDELLKKGVL
ncbi:ParA family protein [Acidaminobacterium chupaoyuni]